MIENNLIYLETSEYLVRHSIVLPSKFSDYDYDDDPNRRFISNIFHKMEFVDQITDMSLCSVLFTSDTAEILCDALYHMNDNLGTDNNTIISKPVLITIDNVYVESFTNKPSLMTLMRELDKLRITVISQYQSTKEVFKILLNENDSMNIISSINNIEHEALCNENWWN